MSLVPLMDKQLLAVFFFLLFVGGCTSFFRPPEYDEQAVKLLNMARKLEKAGKLNEAAQQYILVTTEHPSPLHYKTAVRKAALLLSHPDNPQKNSNTALQWLRKYEELPLSPDEKEFAQRIIILQEKFEEFEGQNAHVKNEYNKLIIKNVKLSSESTKVLDENANLAAENQSLMDANNKLLDDIKELKKKHEADNEKIQEFETKLQQAHQSMLEANRALEKMKDVDALLQSKQKE